MLMMHSPGRGAYQIEQWTQDDFRRHIQFMKTFTQGLQGRGEWVDGQGLAGPDQATIVRAAGDGKPVTDGVFPESKEFLAGYTIIDVDSRERALAVAAEMSAAPGPGGKPLNMPIELREVMAAPEWKS